MITKGLPGRVKYINGDASVPEAGGLRYILQPASTDGTLFECASVKKRWPKVSQLCRQLFLDRNGKLVTGDIQIINVQSDTVVINMISFNDKKLESLDKCFDKIINLNKTDTGCVHINKLKTASQWKLVEKLLENLTKAGVNVTVYQ